MLSNRLSTLLCLLCLAVMPIVALGATGNSTPQSTSANCSINTSIQNAASRQYDKTTGQIMQNSFHDPVSLAAASCIKSLLSFGSNIGIPSLSGLIGDLEDKACSAAQSAKNQALNNLNKALPVDNNTGSFSVNGSGGFNTYNQDQTQRAVNSIWGALN